MQITVHGIYAFNAWTILRWSRMHGTSHERGWLKATTLSFILYFNTSKVHWRSMKVGYCGRLTKSSMWGDDPFLPNPSIVNVSTRFCSLLCSILEIYSFYPFHCKIPSSSSNLLGFLAVPYNLANTSTIVASVSNKLLLFLPIYPIVFFYLCTYLCFHQLPPFREELRSLVICSVQTALQYQQKQKKRFWSAGWPCTSMHFDIIDAFDVPRLPSRFVAATRRGVHLISGGKRGNEFDSNAAPAKMCPITICRTVFIVVFLQIRVVLI